MKKLGTLSDRVLDRLVRNESASAAELLCMDDRSCASRRAYYRVLNGRIYFYRCDC